MNKYRVYVYMNKSQAIRELTLVIDAHNPMEAQGIALHILNLSLSYAPIDGLIDSISVHKS